MTFLLAFIRTTKGEGVMLRRASGIVPGERCLIHLDCSRAIAFPIAESGGAMLRFPDSPQQVTQSPQQRNTN